jgi:putative endonuclease
MTDPRQNLGQRGENFVAAALVRTGYEILDRNWRHALGELDLVARRGSETVFVEVRTRRGPLETAIQAALDSISPRKRARLVELAQVYLAAHDLEDTAWRVDVVAVGCQGGRFVMEVVADALEW